MANPEPYDDVGLTKDQLIAWYERRDFVRQDAYAWLRQPQPPAA